MLITIESTAIENRLAKMSDKLDTVPIPAELTAWQREDMKRRYPDTETINPTTALTVIYPRSRRRASWLSPKQVVRSKPILRGRITRVPGGSNRPILRPELYDRLRERMVEMLLREVKW